MTTLVNGWLQLVALVDGVVAWVSLLDWWTREVITDVVAGVAGCGYIYVRWRKYGREK